MSEGKNMDYQLKKRFKHGFTTISNDALRDTDLSLKAKGLLAYMLALPDDWRFSAERIAKEHTDGIDSVKSALRELEICGYLTRSLLRTQQGVFSGYLYEIRDYKSEEPSVENPSTDKPSTDEPSVGKPSTDNPSTIINKDIVNKEEQKKDIGIEKCVSDDTQKESDRIDLKKFADSWNSIVKKPSVMTLSNGRRKAVKACLKVFSEEQVIESMNKVRDSDFLSGKKGAWRATFDWLFITGNMTKVLEGNYDNDGSKEGMNAEIVESFRDWDRRKGLV